MSAWTSARPPAAAAAAARWTRNSEFLVYLVPVGAISQELYAGYVALLQQHCELPISALTRPGGYAAELSPFKSFSWHSSGAIRFRFVSTTERIESCDGEDVHAWNRPIGVIGICHSPSTPSLADAYAQFTASIKHFPSTLVQKCFAFEHAFDDATVEQVATLSHLVMFPVHHALDAGGSTVSLHLGVVLDTIAVTILLSLESTIRAAMRQQAQTHGHAHHHALPFQSSASTPLEFGDMASVLLDTNVEPSSQTAMMMQQSATSLVLPTATGSAPPQPQAQSLHAALTSMASTAVSTTASALAAPFTDTSRSRKRQVARHRKLFGDYSVLLDCIPDAIEHYTVALELLRDEERKSSGSSGDVLWLAAALEGFVYCLVRESKDQLVVDVFERASEAVALYARAGVSDLECQLIEKLGWYCVVVTSQLEQTAKTTRGSGVERIGEAVWVKRVLWDVLDRGLLVAPALSLSRQLEFVVTASRMLESIGHRRRMALFLHEAAALLVARTSSSSGRAVKSSGSGAGATPPTLSAATMLQRQKDLHAALLLEQLTAARLGIRTGDASSRAAWTVTTLAQSTKTRRGAGSRTTASHDSDAWLILRLHVLRQLLTIATLLQDPLLVARACLQLLHMLPWCDTLATDVRAPNNSRHYRKAAASSQSSTTPIEALQEPFTASLSSRTGTLERQGLFLKTSVYYTPPPSIETKTKRVFSLAGASTATMSSAAASLSSTIASTPRIMLTAPRQQFSAAVSAISTKASPAFASFGHHSHASPHGFSSSSASTSSVSPGVHTGLSSIGSDTTALSPALSPTPATHDVTGKDARGHTASSSSSTPNGASRGPDALAAPVWNIRSRTDVVRMERSVLRLLETECASLRPSEQVTLPTFLRVDAMRVVAPRAHPFVPRAEALAKYAPAGNRSQAPHAAAASDFFYSPFEKRTAAASTSSTSSVVSVFPVYEKIALELVVSNPFGVAIDVQQATAWVEYVDDSDSSGALSTAVECYPCAIALAPYEERKAVALGLQPLREGAFVVRGCFLKALNLKLSCALETPLGLDVIARLPLVALSICEVGRLAHRPPSSSSASSSKPVTEPSDALRLSMFASETKQCELRIRNVSASAITRCRLAATVRRRQVVKQTLVVCSNLLGAESAGVTGACDNSGNTNSSGAVSPFVQVVETDSITLRCTALSHSRSSSDGGDETVPLRSGDVVSLQFEILLRQSRMPRTAVRDDDEPLEEEDEIVWTLVYADDDQEATAPPTTVYYRETTLALTLVSLPSLTLSSATLVPATPESIPASRWRAGARRDVIDWNDEQQVEHDDDELDCHRTTGLDNTHVLLVVQVENPTETAFRLRMRRRRRPSAPLKVDDCANGDGDEGSGDEDTALLGDCDVEIGRKCSRRLAIELPRVHPLSQLLSLPATNDKSAIGTTAHGVDQQRQVLIADVLNALVAIEWETYFGTKGTLEFAHALWQSQGGAISDEDDAAMLELLAPEFAFEISASASSDLRAGTRNGPRTSHSTTEGDDDESAIPMLAAATAMTTADAIDSTADSATAKSASLGHSPFVFCQSRHLSKARRRLDVRLLEFVSIAFVIRWRGFEDASARATSDGGDDDDARDTAQASIEIRITQDGDDDDELASSVADDSVVVVGMLTRDLTVDSSNNTSGNAAMSDSVLDARECVATHEIQVLFLACGDFRVSICGRAWSAARSMVRKVWSHDPLYISVAE